MGLRSVVHFVQPTEKFERHGRIFDSHAGYDLHMVLAPLTPCVQISACLRSQGGGAGPAMVWVEDVAVYLLAFFGAWER